MINFLKDYIKEMNNTSVYRTVFAIQFLLIISMGFFGFELNDNIILNLLTWALLFLTPTIIIVLGTAYLSLKNKMGFIRYTVLSFFACAGLLVVFELFIGLTLDKAINVVGLFLPICIGMFFIALNIMDIEDKIPDPNKTSKLLLHIPITDRGVLWGVCAQDHYVNIITSKGTSLQYMKFSNALNEIDCDEGLQVHRSYWVAEDGLEKIEKQKGRLILTLKNGEKISPSKSGIENMRKAGWIK